MGRKLFRPITQRFGEREIYRDQDSFAGGMVQDPPHSEIPNDSVAKLENAHAFSMYLKGRNGSVLWSDTAYPASRNVRTFTQSGNTVTSSAAIFSQAYVSRWIVWGDGKVSEIVAYISATQVTVNNNADRTDANCRVRRRVNARAWHKTSRKLVIHIGNEFYVADSINMNSWTRIICIEGSPADADSTFDEMDEYLICFTSNGIFKLAIDESIPYCFRINNRVPRTPITSNVQEDYKQFGRRYLFSMSRMTGEVPVRDRNDESTLLEWESGTVKVQKDVDDFGTVWSEVARGDDTKTMGLLSGGVMANANYNVAGVWNIVTDGTFGITYTYEDGTNKTQEIWVDFTGVYHLDQVAERIQTSVNAYFPDFTCIFKKDHFELTSGKIDGTYISWLTAGAAGTDIAATMLCRNGDGGSLDQSYVYEASRTIQRLTIPTVSATDSTRQQLATHYSVYASLDVGPAGTDPLTGIGNNPETFVWLADIRTAGAFYASRSADNIITATYGEFEPADVGSVFEWEDGDRETILGYISSTQVRVASDYYNEVKNLQAGMIGNGTVARASQDGTTVTITGGGTTSSLEVGDTILWSTGARSYVASITSSLVFEVLDSNTRVSQGIVFRPTRRNFHDITSDDILRARVSHGTWLLQQRFWEEMPNGNVGVASFGFMFSCQRGDTKINYGTFTDVTKYLAGCHNPFYQVNTFIKDSINHMMEFPNRLVVWCTNKTYAGPTNESTSLAIEGTGSFITVFNGVQLVNGNIGMRDWGSVRMPVHGKAILFTAEPGVRYFDGYTYGENLAEIKGLPAVMDEIRSWYRATASLYHPNLGYLVWGKQK